MTGLGKMLILLGAVMILVGAAFLLAGKIPYIGMAPRRYLREERQLHLLLSSCHMHYHQPHPLPSFLALPSLEWGGWASCA